MLEIVVEIVIDLTGSVLVYNYNYQSIYNDFNQFSQVNTKALTPVVTDDTTGGTTDNLVRNKEIKSTGVATYQYQY